MIPIKGPKDLAPYQIATIKGATADRYLRSRKLKIHYFSSPMPMFDSMLKGKTQAVVFDAPILSYFANSHGRGKVRLIGRIFQHEKFSFALKSGSPYREAINQAILDLRESYRFPKPTGL